LGTGATQVWFMGGANGTSIASATSLTGATTWRINSVGDVNGDASPDVVWQDPATGTSQVWFLGGPRCLRHQFRRAEYSEFLAYRGAPIRKIE
jgi:hypothetical protein